MARFGRVVSSDCKRTSELADWLSLWVLVIEFLKDRGVLARVPEKFLLYRKGGYVGEDLFAFLLGMFASGFSRGIKYFARRTTRYGAQLAGLVGRKRWPSQASVSRALKSVPEDVVRKFLRFLLVVVDAEGGGRPDLSTWNDNKGEEWNVFHWDVRVTAFRQRGLPEGEDLPSPVRMLGEVGAPGYSGRKRADIQMAVSKVQHSGSGQWVDVLVEKGNGDLTREHRSAHEAVCAWADAHATPASRCILISDGAGGGVEQIRVGLGSAARFLTRSGYYSLLESPEIVTALENSVWTTVMDSGSGPMREAMELGRQALPEIPEFRMVVSRYRKGSKKGKRGVGKEMAGFVYEIFVTDVPDGAFTAASLVALFYSRCGIENQFASENREFAMGLLYSTNPAGQMLTLGIGMFLWNLQGQMGLRAASGNGELPEPPVKPADEACNTRAHDNITEPSTSDHPEENHADSGNAPVNIPSIERLSVLAGSKDESDMWSRKLKRYIDWEWDPLPGAPRCPMGHVLPLHRIRLRKRGGYSIRFRGMKRHCARCSNLCGCSQPHGPKYRRVLDVPLTKDEAERTGLAREAGRVTNISMSPLYWIGPKTLTTSPLQNVRPPILLVAELRKLISTACESIVAQVVVSTPPQESRQSPYLALSPAIRQRRRKTWTERRLWNALPEETDVRVQLAGDPLISTLLKSRPETQTVVHRESE